MATVLGERDEGAKEGQWRKVEEEGVLCHASLICSSQDELGIGLLQREKAR